MNDLKLPTSVDVDTDFPSLRPLVPEVLAGCYARAVKRAAIETGLPTAAFPGSNTYSPAEVLDDDFVP